LSLGTGWLALLWLAVAVRQSRPVLFAAFQVALTLAVCHGVTAWLELQPGVTAGQPLLEDPRSLQAYGVGLGVLSVLWLVARLSLRSNLLARSLLEPGWVAVDRVVFAGLVVGQF